MSQKLIIALDAGTPTQRDVVTDYIRDKGWKVWHWVADLWLLADVPPEASPGTLWADLTASPSLRSAKGLVMRVDPELTHWGGNDPASWVWMKENWGTPDFSTGRLEAVGTGEA